MRRFLIFILFITLTSFQVVRSAAAGSPSKKESQLFPHTEHIAYLSVLEAAERVRPGTKGVAMSSYIKTLELPDLMTLGCYCISHPQTIYHKLAMAELAERLNGLYGRKKS